MSVFMAWAWLVVASGAALAAHELGHHHRSSTAHQRALERGCRRLRREWHGAVEHGLTFSAAEHRQSLDALERQLDEAKAATAA